MAPAANRLPVELRGPVEVMLASSSDEVPAQRALRGGCVYEPKWDGFRLVLVHSAGAVRAWSRNGKDLTSRFPDVVDAAGRALPREVVVDGEVVIWHDGRLDFDLLQARLTTKAAQVRRTARARPASFMAFDLLAASGQDLRPLPWSERRAQLESLCDWEPPLQLSPVTSSRHEALGWFEDYRVAGVEGLVAKGAQTPYSPGGRGWVKVKCRESQEVIVGAVVGPLSAPREVICGLMDGQRLVVVGRTVALSRAQSAQLAGLLTEADAGHPWPTQIGAGRFGGGKVDITRVDPALVIEISADVALSGGRFRHPVRFVRQRPDMDPEQVPQLGDR